jgi:hypothetical protein
MSMGRLTSLEAATTPSAVLVDRLDPQACLTFAHKGGCEDVRASKVAASCAAACKITAICSNQTETGLCIQALRCQPMSDSLVERAHSDSLVECAERAKRGECNSNAVLMLKDCIRSCATVDLDGLMHFHLPHFRVPLSPLIDLPGHPPRVAGMFSLAWMGHGERAKQAHLRGVVWPQHAATSLEANGRCPHVGFGQRMDSYRKRHLEKQPWGQRHWHLRSREKMSPRVPPMFSTVAADLAGSSRNHKVVVQHISFSPRIRYLHQFLSSDECAHMFQLAAPLFERSSVRSHAAHAARTSSTASLDGADVSDDTIVQRIRARVARFAGVGEDFLEPLQVVRYNQGQHYAKHHDFFPICDIADKYRNGRRTRTFLIYLNDLPDGEIGGGTQFPELEVELRPEKGAALVWNNCLDNGHEDGRTLHAGLPLHEPGSVKYAINGKSLLHRRALLASLARTRTQLRHLISSGLRHQGQPDKGPPTCPAT